MIERHRSIVAVRLAPTSLASDAPRSSDTSAITTLAPFWASLRTVAEPKPPARHIPRPPRRPCRTARRPTRPRAGAGPPPTAASPRSPAGAPAGRPAPAARRHGPAAPRRVPATAPRVPPSVRRPRATHTSTTTHPFRYSHFRRFWLRPALCGTTRGLTQAPRFAIYWKWKGVGTVLSTYRPLWTDNLLAKRRRAAYGGTSAQEDLLWGASCSGAKTVWSLNSRRSDPVLDRD